MEPNWASDNLQVIRTLMERATVYRRALAPMMIAVGCIGLLAAAVGFAGTFDQPSLFIRYWLGVAVFALIVSFALARRQAIKAAESFWSPPARRVAQGMTVPLLSGLLLTVGPMAFWGEERMLVTWVLPIWMLCYASALHAAGAYMPRGIKLLAWVFVAFAVVFLGHLISTNTREIPIKTAHGVMGVAVGLLQLAYGIYLHFTEKRNDAA